MPRESVWKLITDRGLTDQVQWEDRRQTLEEVRLAYLSHDVLLFNSLRESGGAQLLEAMAQGLPLIALNLHGPGDLIPNDAGIKIDVHSPSQVIRDGAAAIEKFSTLSGEERSRMSLAGWRFSHSLTYSKRAEESEKLYKEISGYPVSQREQVATVD